MENVQNLILAIKNKMENNNTKWYVYCHTNKINGKKYIGISKNPYKRWASNGINYRQCKHFYNAIQKYGWDNFKHDIIKEVNSKEEAFDLEKTLIREYNTTDKQCGYNISFGGTAPMEGKHHSKETREMLSEKNIKYWKGKHLSEATKEKISQTKINNHSSSWNKGLHHSEETKDKISYMLQGKFVKEKNPNYGRLGELNPLSFKIYCIELNKWFVGIREAARELGLNSSNIIRSLKSKGKNSGGKVNKVKTHWLYEKDFEELYFTNVK